MEKLINDLDKRAGVVERLVKRLQELKSETESRRWDVDSIGESAADRTMLEKRLKDLEEREKEFESYQERKEREIVAKDEELRLKRDEFLEEVRLRELKLDEQWESVNERGVWLEVAQNEILSIRRLAREKLREIESQERDLRSAQELLAARERSLVLDEEKLSIKREEFAKNVKWADDKLTERDKLWCGFMEDIGVRLEGMGAKIVKRFREIEYWGNVVWNSATASIEEADVIGESLERLFNEFEKMERQFTLIHEEEMRELVAKEQQLSLMNEELLTHVKLRDEQLTELDKLSARLLKRFELAENNVKDLKTVVSERFNEISSKEIDIACNMHLVERKREEVDSKAKELEEREKQIKTAEVNMDGEKIIFQMKSKEIDLKEKILDSWEKELCLKQRDVDSAYESNEQLAKELDWKEKNLNSVKGFVRNCFNEHLSLKKKLRTDRDLLEKHAREVECKEQQLECRVREFELREEQIRDCCKEFELERQQLIDALNAPIKIVPDKSVDIIFVVKMDGKTLQMFLNDPEKDLELMGDEIFKVLHLSSDPAKLVLDAMSGFYPPHLRKEDMEFSVRRTCIVLLVQLIKMKPKIEPSVSKEALELASEWKSKMKITPENPLEVLGFLHLLAAYSLASYFDKKLLLFLTKVAQHKGTPEFCSALAFMDSITGLTHDLSQELDILRQ